MTATPPLRPARVPPARSLTGCPPCQSPLSPPPTRRWSASISLISRLRISSATPTSRRCLATSPPCQVSRSHRRPLPATKPRGSNAKQSTSEPCMGVAGCWCHPPPLPPWTKTSPSPRRTSPHPPLVCPHPGWTPTLLLSPLPPRLHRAGTSPHIETCRPALDASRPDGRSHPCATSHQKGILGDTGENSPPGGISPLGVTSHLSPLCPGPPLQQGGTSNGTCPREAATGA